jgi:hypothetical protein
MNLWTFIVAVVFIGVAGEAFRNWLRYRERIRAAEAAPDGTVDELRRRIEALETIVTERGYDLKAEIDRLDDRHRRAS